MLKVKSIPFVGGDTQTFEFDFGTKVAGSVAECPLKIYASLASTIQSPNNVTGNETTGWHEIDAGYGGQNWLDKIKNLDNQCPLFYASSNGQIGQLMVEVDLTPLCNSLFGGSTSAMQAALNSRSYSVDFYAKGSGSNNGVQANGVYFATWHNSGVWAEGNKTLNNMTNAVTKVSTSKNQVTDSNSVGSNYITSGNKMYFLIAAYYPSNGTVPSEVDIDYLNIKVSFARVPDVIAPISLTLPGTWSLLIKGFSPMWDNTVGSNKVVFSLNSGADTSTGKFISSFYDIVTKQFVIGDIQSPMHLNAVGNKFQSINFLIEQVTSGTRVRVLVNGSTVQKFTNNCKYVNSNIVLGLLLGQQFNGYQADAFLNSLMFIPNKTFDDDTEAESILRGTAQGFEEDELVPEQYQKYSFSASGQYAGPGFIVPVLPNNRYHFECNVAVGGVEVFEKNSHNQNVNNMYPGQVGGMDFVTSAHTTGIWIRAYTPDTLGKTVIINKFSLKLKM